MDVDLNRGRPARPFARPLIGSLAFAAVLTLSPIATAQKSSKLGDLPAPPKGLEPAPVLLASDGKAVQPGRIPEGTSERARQLWERAVGATGAKDSQPLEGFDLNFEVTVRRDHSQNNLGQANYRFWSDPGFLRSEWKKSGRVQLRGPGGDWLIEKGVQTELVGRENRQSRRELDEWVTIARNFLAIATPSATRIVELGEVKQLDVALPTGTLEELAKKLDWVSVTSPDFRLVSSENPNAVYKAYLGLDRPTGEVRICLLHEDGAERVMDESTILVSIPEWKDVGQRKVPRNLLVYQTDRERMGRSWFFRDRPGADLWLGKGGTLKPEFKPEEFMP